jgi:hypothetical protein
VFLSGGQWVIAGDDALQICVRFIFPGGSGHSPENGKDAHQQQIKYFPGHHVFHPTSGVC